MDRRYTIGCIVFVLLSSVYLLTFSGYLRSVDELAMFALTESLVQTHSTDTPQLQFAAKHNPVGRIEPLQSLLTTPLYWLAVRNHHLGNIQVVMLFNVFVTAATGTLLTFFLIFLDHPPERAALVALLYGLATIAWPYSRTFFREPLLALLLTAAGYSLIRWQASRSWGWGGLVLVFLSLALITKVTSFLAWLAFGLVFVFEPGVPKRERGLRLLLPLVLGVGVGIAADPIFKARVGSGIIDTLLKFSVLDQPLVFLSRVFGLTLGAGRGLFVYIPLLLLALPGVVWLWQRHKMAGLFCLVVLLTFVGGYGNWIHWHGGLVWGPRFLVPIVPILMVACAETLSRAKGFGRVVVVLLVGASLVIQVTASTNDFSGSIVGKPWDDLFHYAQSPVVDQVARWRADRLDLLWWHQVREDDTGDMALDWTIAAVPAATLVGSTVLYMFGRRKRRLATLLMVPLLLALLVGTVILARRAPQMMVGYRGIDLGELREVASIINRDQAEPHVVVTVSNEFHLNPLLNAFKGPFVHHWLSPMQETGLDPILTPPPAAQSLRLIVDRTHMQPDHPRDSAEFWLNAHLHRYFFEWVGDAYQVYSYLYPRGDLVLQPAKYLWSPGMTLSAYAIGPQTLSPGQPFWLEFHFSATETPDADYDVLLQLLSPDGDFVNGTDGAPQFGAAPTSTWTPGDTVVDRRACFVPVGAAPGTYRVIAGFYRGQERQTVFDATGQPLGTHVELGEIQVTAP